MAPRGLVDDPQRMVPHCKAGFRSKKPEPLIQVDPFVIYLQVFLVQFCSLQHLVGQLSQTCCLFIDERHKFSFRIFEPVDLEQSRASALDGCQGCLECVGQSVENRSRGGLPTGKGTGSQPAELGHRSGVCAQLAGRRGVHPGATGATARTYPRPPAVPPIERQDQGDAAIARLQGATGGSETQIEALRPLRRTREPTSSPATLRGPMR